MGEHAAGASLRVGLLSPHAAAGPEVEIPDVSHGNVSVMLNRVSPAERSGEASWSGAPSVRSLRDLASPRVLDESAQGFRSESVDAVAHASTTTGYVLGARFELVMLERLSDRCGVPAVGSSRAAVEALRADDAHRLVLVHPPWFDAEIDELGVEYFRGQGFGVSMVKAHGLPAVPGKASPRQIVDWVIRHLPEADGPVFLAGNGFRGARAVAELEHRTGRVVLTANQVLLWSLLAATRTRLQIRGFGRIFDSLPQSPSQIEAM
jgi:maleate isomerase